MTSVRKSTLRYMLSGFWLATIIWLLPAQSPAEVSHPATIGTIQYGHGMRFTDKEGMTLYQFENDLREPGTSTCIGDCAMRYPPLLATDNPIYFSNNWSLIDRKDGTKQWALQGMPLYKSSLDGHKGAAYGEGQGWIVAFKEITTPNELSITNTTMGYVLASSNGRTLYVRNRKEESECRDECLERWVPMKAPWVAKNFGNFTVHSREDGIYQWAYQGQPLFLFLGDSVKGDLNGNGIEEAWQAMLLEPAPPLPNWVKIVGSDGGPLYANKRGRTLYTLYEEKNSTVRAYQGGNHCDESCLEKYWTAVSASSEMPAVGKWSVIKKGEEGLLQWAYMGRPLYTLKLETRPGQLYYTTFRQFQWMKPIMYSLPALQGVFF